MLPVIPLKRHGGPLFQQVYERLRQAIVTGALRDGDPLPSTRDLARDLQIARTVAVSAYELLLAEGLAEARQGSKTYVSRCEAVLRPTSGHRAVNLRLTSFAAEAPDALARVKPPSGHSSLPYDFAHGRSDLETFPLELWRRILLRCARKASVSQLDYGTAAGTARLREALCTHLRRTRAVRCEPTQVLISNGSQQALGLIARALVEPGAHVIIEEPVYHGTREILRAAGAHLCPVPVDCDGLDPARLPVSARVAFVTPSHQFPSGAVLPLSRRLALLEWANAQDAAIVEDDYNGEFRYEGEPLESLHGLDGGERVIHVGTFSRTMFPALRIGYLVAPAALMPAITYAKWLSDIHTGTLEQLALAEFIESGAYATHLRRVRRRNAQRRSALLEAIKRHLNGRVQLSGESAGGHVVLWPVRGAVESAFVSAASARGVGIYGLSAYYLKAPPRPGFLLGYDHMTEDQISEGIRRLRGIF